ncbi:hypothetical protein TcWFU_004795 [Taenia crassiceps]|uniref:Uncharacterized protein n=1 Tax=Taenia crassiceps TaxID=6207 RepID=A0ABR4QLL9_9CEST
MVTGAYAKGNGSRSKPVVLKYAPSHAERPRTRDSREKGKGWQRSKSSMYDYGSDLYFCEDRTSHERHRRAQSSMSGRRTGKNSSCYEIDCPAKKQRRRRASVEAIVQSAKPDSTNLCQPAVPIGPPIQKRMLTVKQGAEDNCITPNKTFYGWTTISNDRSLQKVQIIEREGPKARAYAPRYESANNFPSAFPYAESERELKTYECKQRFMEMLVTTDSFDWRPGAGEPEGHGYETDEIEPFKVKSSFRPPERSPANKYLNEMRIELKEAEVSQDRVVQGRVFFDLKEPATVESIVIDINKTFAGTTSDGRVNLLSPDNKNYAPELKLLPNRQPRLLLPGMEPQPGESSVAHRLPDDIALVETIPKKVILQTGYNAIPFSIYVPENQMPTFTYTSLDGPSVINNYSAEASVRMNGNTERTGRVPIVVPALGKKNLGYRDDDDNFEFVLFNKYFTKDDGFDYAVGYTEKESGHDKPSKVEAKVIRLAECREINLKEKTYVANLGHATMSRGKSNPVVDKYRQNPDNKPIRYEWDDNAYDENNVISSTTPTVKGRGFTCDYLLELKVDGKTYRGPIILVDRYDEKGARRSELSSLSKREDFKVPA